jgi:hypothetical protein
MAKSSSLIRQLARTGAVARLNELKAEIAAIERAFPDLAGGGRSGRPRATDAALVAKKRTRKPMTAAQKKAVGERMKKYWVARRKATAKS